MRRSAPPGTAVEAPPYAGYTSDPQGGSTNVPFAVGGAVSGHVDHVAVTGTEGMPSDWVVGDST